jgi:hypothetical protein
MPAVKALPLNSCVIPACARGSELDFCYNTFDLPLDNGSSVVFSAKGLRCISHLYSTFIRRLQETPFNSLSYPTSYHLPNSVHILLVVTPIPYSITKFPWWSLAILCSSKSSSGMGIDMVSCRRRRLCRRASSHMAQARATLKTPRTNVTRPKIIPIVLSVERFPRA